MEAPHAPQAPKILVAEDDTKLLTLLNLQLKAAGYRVVCAQDGYQAIEYARRELPDVIVLDVHLPAGDGFSVQERLQKMPELTLVPVIYVTGDRSDQLLHNTALLGAFAVIHKPFEVTHLLSKIRAALRRANERATLATERLAV